MHRPWIIAGLAVLICCAAAHAADTPSRFVADTAAEALGIWRDEAASLALRRQRARALIERRFDVPKIADEVLGPAARSASVRERFAFAAALVDDLVATYMRRRDDRAPPGFQVIEERLENRRTAVVSSWGWRAEDGATVVIDWRLSSGAAGWRVADLIIAGISAVQTKRGEVARLLAEHGGDLAAVTQTLRAHAAAE